MDLVTETGTFPMILAALVFAVEAQMFVAVVETLAEICKGEAVNSPRPST